VEKQDKIQLIESLMIRVLKAMHSRRIYGSNHKQFETMMRSCSVGSDQLGLVKEAIERLLKFGYVVWYDKGRKAIQLNKKLSGEIDRIIRENKFIYLDPI